MNKKPKQQAEPKHRQQAERDEINLSPPWSPRFRQQVYLSGHHDGEAVREFVRNRTRVHELYIKQQARVRIVGLVLAFILIVISACLVVFAPDGRESLSYWIGAALVIFAAGAVGYQRVWGKGPKVSFGADQDDRPLE